MAVPCVQVPSAHASVTDAKLREALKAHDLLVELVRPQGMRRPYNEIMRDLEDVFNTLDELEDVRHG